MQGGTHQRKPGLCGVGTVVESGCRVVQERAGPVGSWYILWNPIAGWYWRKSWASLELEQLWNPVAGWYIDPGLWAVRTVVESGCRMVVGTGERARPLWG